MLTIFKIPVGRVCQVLGCELTGRQIEQLHERNCSACGCELVLVTKTDRQAVGLAIVAVFILLISAIFSVRAWHQYRTSTREAELLLEGKARLEAALAGATAARAPAILDSVQKELSLSEEQRGRLEGEAAPLIARLPRDLDERMRMQIEAYVRDELNRDDILSVEVRQKVDELVAAQRIDPESAAAFIADSEKRIRSAKSSIALGSETIVNEPAEALAHFKRAAETDPRSCLAWANLGGAEMVLGHAERARRAYRRAIEVDSRCWLAHYNMGLAAAREPNLLDTALRHVGAAIEALPADSATRDAVLDDLRTNPVFEALRRDRRYSEILSHSDLALPSR